MNETLFRFLSLDQIDKQILKKIPYHLFIFLIITWFGYSIYSENTIYAILLGSLTSFVFFNALFNYRLNIILRNYMDYAEFDDFITKFSGIIDGTRTILSEEVQKRKLLITFSLMVLSGGSLLLFLYSIFTLIFRYFQVGTPLQLLLLVLIFLYIYTDITKLDFLDQNEIKEEHSFSIDLLEKFTVTNPLKKLPFAIVSRYVVFFLLRIISPVANAKFSPPYVGLHFYYREDDINNLILEHVKAEEGIIFKEMPTEKTFSLNTIMTNDKPSSLLTLNDRNIKKNFPFLFDPNYHDIFKEQGKEENPNQGEIVRKPDPEMKYTILRVLLKMKNETDETVGYLFIRLFHGLYIKKKYDYSTPHGGFRNEDDYPIHIIPEKKFVYCIISLGKKDTMEGIEKLFSANASTVQPESFNIEIGNIKKK